MSHVISVLSPNDGEVLFYPLVVICGTTKKRKAKCVYVLGYDKRDLAYNEKSEAATFPVRNRKFKALFHLQPGINHIKISHSSHFTNFKTLTLSHALFPTDSPRIRLVYLLTSDSNGVFQTPDPLTQEDALNEGPQRLLIAGLMIQAATAEMLHNEGFGRRTFALTPEVMTFRLSGLNAAKALELEDQDLYRHIASELSSTPNRSEIIDIVVMSFTRKINGRLFAHTALGGGQLALFGGASIFTWPSSVRDICPTFLDARPIDSDRFFDDSGGRGAQLGRRASTSTTIGALLHELGHCFSLPHPCADANANGGGIMSRGFDDFDRLFVQPGEDDLIPFWDRGSAVRLRHHRFLQFPSERQAKKIARLRSVLPSSSSHARIQKKGGTISAINSGPFANPMRFPKPKTLLDEELPSIPTFGPPVIEKMGNGDVRVSSTVGLGHIGYYRNRDNASHDEFLKTHPTSYILPSLIQLRKRCCAGCSDLITISAMDVDGQITEQDYLDIPVK